MRAVICLVALVGCFNPTTNQSCQYQCAAMGTPCPSGLSCVGGVCVAPGEMCMSIDGGVDANDGRTGACGDGIRDPGEVCYGTPITVMTSGGPHDGQLADIDGDGDLDLVYVIAGQYVFHVLAGGIFSAAQNGPTVNATRMLALDVDGDAHAELINGAANVELWNHADTSFTRTGVFALTAGQDTVALATGLIAGTTPNVLALGTSELWVLTIDASGALAFFAVRVSITDPRDLAAGRLDADPLDDIVIAHGAGIDLHTANASGLATEVPLPVSGLVTGVAVADTDNDANLDVVFTQVTGTSGEIGVMRAMGGGAFASPTLSSDVPGLSGAIDTGTVDGDNLADIVAISTNPKAVLIALGRTDGTLAAPVEIALNATPSYLHAGNDFNGDNVSDIVVTDLAGQRIVILPSNP
ncbi:MAG TPA: hypothetical protein VIV11_41900 [Kofleriaceae bacterium]